MTNIIFGIVIFLIAYFIFIIPCSVYADITLDFNELEMYLSPFYALARNFEQLSSYDRSMSDIIFTILYFGYIIFVIFGVYPKYYGQFFSKKEKLHGDAHWATQEEIEAAKLKSKDGGVLLGQDNINGGYFISDRNNFEHILLFAPTGSGKGTGFVIPNCLYWEGSMVVNDIKGENFDFASRYRQDVMKQEVYRWEPANLEGITHRYNPLDWIPLEDGPMVDSCQKLASLLLPKQEFWVIEARNLCLGMILLLLADPTRPNNFGELTRMVRSEDLVATLSRGLDTFGGRVHPVGYMNLSAFLQKADKEQSGVMSYLSSSLELWANPLIDNATSESDFDIQQMKRKKTSVFCVVTPDNIIRLQNLLQIFYQQAIDILSKNIPDLKDEPHGVMFLMDEFPALGKMEIFKSSIAYLRGYRVKLFLVVQDTQQLKASYEDAGMNSFLSNCKFRITYATNSYDTAKFVSDMLGTKTVDSASRNKASSLTINSGESTGSISDASRALLMPQEVISLPTDEQIIMIEAVSPIRCKKIYYFKDPMFTERLLGKTPVPKHNLFSANYENYAQDTTIDKSISIVNQAPESKEITPGSKVNIDEVFRLINDYNEFVIKNKK